MKRRLQSTEWMHTIATHDWCGWHKHSVKLRFMNGFRLDGVQQRGQGLRDGQPQDAIALVVVVWQDIQDPSLYPFLTAQCWKTHCVAPKLLDSSLVQLVLGALDPTHLAFALLKHFGAYITKNLSVTELHNGRLEFFVSIRKWGQWI